MKQMLLSSASSGSVETAGLVIVVSGELARASSLDSGRDALDCFLGDGLRFGAADDGGAEGAVFALDEAELAEKVVSKFFLLDMAMCDAVMI